MPFHQNAFDNSMITSLTQRAGPKVVGAIKNAAQRTGVNFAYLLEKAAAESNFKTDAKARTSSATGLYQFIESTWLGMVKKHGHKYGLGEYANKIGDNGKVSDPATRREVLSLRNDPETASLMAAEFASDNERYLRSHVKGRDIGATELYFAHFMGAGGGAAFLNALDKNPMQNAADLFPQAARANRNVFYDAKTGKPRTMAGVYDFFDRKFDDAANPQNTAPRTEHIQLAAAPIITDHAINQQRETIHWFSARYTDDSRTAGRMPVFNNRNAVAIDPIQIMMMAELDMPGGVARKARA